MAQTGCPKGDGTGVPGYNIYCECLTRNDFRRFFTGTLGMAHAGPNTGGSQFFITFLSFRPHCTNLSWCGIFRFEKLPLLKLQLCNQLQQCRPYNRYDGTESVISVMLILSLVILCSLQPSKYGIYFYLGRSSYLIF